VDDNMQLSWVNVKKVLGKIGMTLSNLPAVYFLEYSITTAFTQSTTN